MLIWESQGQFDLHHQASPRSPGIHVSECLKEVCLNLGVWKRDDQEDLDFTLAKYHASHGDDIIRMYPTAIYRIAAGLAWEQWYGHQKPEINFHQIGELKKDRIIGTPDGLEFDDKGGLVHEIKWTWKSSRSDRETPQERLRPEFYWTSQACSYCYLSTVGKIKTWRQNGIWLASDNLVNRVVLHVYWCNGNYKGSGPELRVYLIEYSVEEVMSNWKLVTLKRTELEEERREKTQTESEIHTTDEEAEENHE